MEDENARTLVSALDVLDDRERQMVISLYRDGRSYRQTASDLGVSARTIQRWRAKATAKLAAALEGEAAEALLKPIVPANEQISFRTTVRPVPWSRCCKCDTPVPTAEEYCDRCGPVAAAAAVAYRS